jgi:hypothetical protein
MTRLMVETIFHSSIHILPRLNHLVFLCSLPLVVHMSKPFTSHPTDLPFSFSPFGYHHLFLWYLSSLWIVRLPDQYTIG